MMNAPTERVSIHFTGCLPWRKNTEKEETGDLAHDNDNMYNFKLFIILASSDCIDTLTVSNFCANFFLHQIGLTKTDWLSQKFLRMEILWALSK